MEVLLVIAALIYSVWSEVNKKKEEENIDIDFSELSSLDEFFQPGKGSTGGDKKKTPKQPVSRLPKKAKASTEGINYDTLPALTTRNDREKADESRPELQSSFDENASVSGRINYERDQFPAPAKKQKESQLSEDSVVSPAEASHENFAEGHFKLSTNELAKTLILAEVLQRYDLTRIYSRIPDFKSED